MGGFLDKPLTMKSYDSGEGNKLRYGVSKMQGWRRTMEDYYCARTQLDEHLEDWSYFAVFDGHSGHKISSYCSRYLLGYIVTKKKQLETGDYVNAIRDGFLDIDETMRNVPMLNETDRCGGTTAVCAFVSPTQMYIANCGDSRAVLCRQGSPVFATEDHKPVLPEETKRIQNAGGRVMTKRVNGALAVSRSLGDYEFKRNYRRGPLHQLISPEPEIFCQTRQDSDEFLVLASDGVWDVMSNEDICSFILSRLKITNDLVSVANDVLDTCLHKGSRDNMSIIIITFPGAPNPSEEAIEADKRLDAEIERIAKEQMVNCKSYTELLGVLKDIEIEGLPPGGGLQSKYGLIQQLFSDDHKTSDCDETSTWEEELA